MILRTHWIVENDAAAIRIKSDLRQEVGLGQCFLLPFALNSVRLVAALEGKGPSGLSTFAPESTIDMGTSQSRTVHSLVSLSR